MNNITPFALDHAAAEHLASDAPAFAQTHALMLAPHEATIVAIAHGTAVRRLENSNAPQRLTVVDIPTAKVERDLGSTLLRRSNGSRD